MEKNRVGITLTDEATAIMNAHASERKRGEWVSGVITAYVNSVGMRDSSDLGTLERLEAKIDKVLLMLSKQDKLAV